ncbi:MAG TPA: hypothetical protein PKA42_01780 [Candidatus Paceibacterota bacterium]|nr:hypothetical protein [Candidatus Paceibacterota bacterium]HMO82874.1 hypothetical protein [Candidatus Paceibacterota bacterium]
MNLIHPIILSLLLLIVPFNTEASSVLRMGESATFAVDQMVEGDLYWAANTVVISGEVTDDLLLLGGEVTVNGKVGADLLALGGRVDVHGFIGDDARIVAGEVVIAGEIQGDLVVVASNLKVLSTAKISGDLMFFGDTADISGEIGKSVLGTSNTIRIDSIILGDVQVKTNTITLGERTNINGNLSYTSVKEVNRAAGAVVGGKVVQNQPNMINGSVMAKDIVIPFLVILFAALIWYLLFSRFLFKVSNQINNHFLRTTLIGFGIFFLVPIAAVILLLSTLGSILGIILILAYFALLLMSLVISGTMAGAYALKLANKPVTISLLLILFGTAGYYLLLYVPIIGAILMIIISLATLGGLSTSLYRLMRSE